MMLLEDVFIIENLQIINEGDKSGPMKIRGCFQRADEANNNKRIYRKPLLEREINKLADAMNERRLLGELDHPQNDSVRLSNVSHLITGLKMKGNEVIGEAEILNTPSGKVAQALIEGGVKIGISSRGMGTVTEELDGKRYVNEDFKLITWDIVADPSTRGAYPGLTESTLIQYIIDTVYPEAQKVKNFTTLLKEELIFETKKKKKSTSRWEETEKGSTIFVKTAAAKRADRGQPPISPGLQSAAKQGMALTIRKPAKANKKAEQEYMTPQQHSSTQFVNFMRDKLMEAKAYKGDPKERAMRRADAARRALRARPQKPRTIARMGTGTASTIRIHRREKAIAASPKIGPRQSRGSQSMPSSAAVGSAQTRNQGGGFRRGLPKQSKKDRRADFDRDTWRRQAPGDR